MHQKLKNISFLNKILIIVTAALSISVTAQEKELVIEATKAQDTTKKTTPGEKMRQKIDGIVGVVGDFIVLDSDVDKAYIDLKNQGVSTTDISRCQLVGSLLETKLYTHHAIQDSLPLSDQQIQQQVDQQFNYMKEQLGSTDKVLKFYKKDNLVDFKKELFDLGKNQRLSQLMQEKIVNEVTVTPDEVKQFFKAIPEEERPLIDTEIEISQIVIKPKPSPAEVKSVVERLEGFRKDVVENGSSFATKAVLYSQDPGSRANGGKYTISRKDPFAKEFKDVAFSLQAGEVSKPFKTDFGWHIVTVDKIKGQQIDVRHILLIPEVGSSELKKYKAHADSIRSKIVDGQFTFDQAARLFSDEKETKGDGGILINPVTQDTRFELTKIDPILYGQVSGLEEGQVSNVIEDKERTGGIFYKLVTVSKKFPEHTADYAKDYLKIKDLALKKKQLEAVQKWQEEKIIDTYVKINEPYQTCDFKSDWVKN